MTLIFGLTLTLHPEGMHLSVETLIDKIRKYEKTMGLNEAMIKAVEECINENILKDILLKRKGEVINMLTAEWNLKTALQVEREEGREEGEARGEARTTDKVLELIRKGLSPAEIEKELMRSYTPEKP